jgi:UDP-glucose 4-epimerase
VLELAEALGRLAGRPFEPEFADPRPGEVERIALDAKRARDRLGWEAQTGLEEGLRTTLDAMR